MRLRSLALAAVSAAFAGVMATAPNASAAHPSGNCPVGSFCVWENYGDMAGMPPNEPPVVLTSTDWTGSATGVTVYNNGSRDARIVYIDSAGRQHEDCEQVWYRGSFFYNPATITKVTWVDDC